MVAQGSRHQRASSSTTTRSSSSSRRRLSSTSHDKKKPVKPLGICSFCLGDENKNANDVPEDMISCAECGNCGHPTCLKYPDRLVKKIKTVRWQCHDCKRCIICNKSDDSLLFCDYCDATIHPKCCNPPLNHIPKGDYACYNCRNDGTAKSSEKKSFTKTSTTRSLRSNNSNDEDVPMVISRPVAQLIDGMSNFFLPKKHTTTNSQRQQSVQKAMKFLRKRKHKTSNENVLKRFNKILKTTSKTNTNENQLLARSILNSSKTTRVRRKPVNLADDSSTRSQIDVNTPTMTRRSLNKKALTSQPVTPSPRTSRRSGTLPLIESSKTASSSTPRLNSKRKRSSSPVTVSKRTKADSSIRKTPTTNKKPTVEDDKSESEDEPEPQTKPSVTKRKLNLDLSKYKTPPSFLRDSLPDTIVTNDVYLFLDARKNSSKLISDCSERFRYSTETIEDEINSTRWPPYIVFGDEMIKTWYSSSYPQEYARVPRLYICEFCLKYMKCEQVYDRHRRKCETFHPPANEIYHKDDLSVFEVDGNINRIYCQNLCLLAKLFLDHKTLYYDVEPFLFYVLTKNDANGCHFVGYFSKEKHCPQKYNLSCITVLPNCQRQGYGRFLIELSYLLSKKEGQIGTPERPLSMHGAQTYEAYWKIKIVQQLQNYYFEKKEKCILRDLMNETGMTAEDIIDTLQNLGILTMKSNESAVVMIDGGQLESILKTEKIKHTHWVSLDNEFLRFTPVIKPILFIHDENSIENQTQMIQVVFKKIQQETSEHPGNNAELGEGSNQASTTEVVRYVRRRKFGRKRRSVYVKYRVVNKNEANVTNNDDEHSQEYVARRQDSIKEEKNEEKQEQEPEPEQEQKAKVEENKQETILSPSPAKSPVKQPTFKQLTLDQFLKKIPSNSPVTEKSMTNVKLEAKTDPIEDTKEIKSEIEDDKKYVDDEDLLLSKRTRKLSNTSHISKSETDLSKIMNGDSLESAKTLTPNNQSFLIRQLSDGTVSSNDSSITTLNSPLPFKKRAWNSANLDALIDPPSYPKKITQSVVLSRETSITTASSTPENPTCPLMTSSSSINSIDDQPRITSAETETKSTMQPVTEVEDADDQPPSLTTPTSMVVSQSNHFNYVTRSSVAKQQQQQQQSITINNFTSSTNMTYNLAQAPYPYPFPAVSPLDIPPYYYSTPMPMNFLPYFPPSSSPSTSSSMFPSGQPMCYQPNGNDSIPFPTGNSSTPFNYSTSHSSPSRRH